MSETFKNSLKQTIQKNTLNASNWKADSWRLLIQYVNQDILNDAFAQHDKLKNMFGSIGTIVPRKCKQMSRIGQKTDEVRERGGEYFKVLSDFIAGRNHCEITAIPDKIDKIREIVKNHNGTVYVRGESEERPYGFCMDKDKKFTDITQYAYVYVGEIGYPVELQIGHEFASYTFTNDSALRDNPECGAVDLWKDGYYNMVKTYLLNKANGVPIVAGNKYDIWDRGFQLHNYKVPDEFKGILERL